MVSIDGCGEQQSTVVYDSNFNILKEYLWHVHLVLTMERSVQEN